MAAPGTVPVTGPGRRRGTIGTAPWPVGRGQAEVLLRFDGGEAALAPLEAPVCRNDGSNHPTVDPAIFERREADGGTRESPLVSPVIEEARDGPITRSTAAHHTAGRRSSPPTRHIALRRGIRGAR